MKKPLYVDLSTINGELGVLGSAFEDNTAELGANGKGMVDSGKG